MFANVVQPTNPGSRIRGRGSRVTDPGSRIPSRRRLQGPYWRSAHRAPGTLLDRRRPAGAGTDSVATENMIRGEDSDTISDDAVVEAVLLASRCMVALAEASVRQVSDDVTLAQFRTLALLMAGGPCRLGDLARATGVNPSTATRMCDRLVRKDLVTRSRDRIDRRETVLSLTDQGNRLVHAVTASRRRIIRSMLQTIPLTERGGLVRALSVLADATSASSDLGDATTHPLQPYWASGWTGP